MKKIVLLFIHFLIFGLYSSQPPAGYYNAANGLTGASLKSALKQIITNGHINQGYSGLWTAYATTDRDYFYENDGTILDIYSENPTGNDPYNFTYGPSPSGDQCGNYQNEGDCYNREHIVPQNLFDLNNDGDGDQPMVSDIHFIRATDGKVNGIRSSYPFGLVGSGGTPTANGSKLGTSVSAGYSGMVFEPIDAFKGDVARMIFYFVTRYENQLSTFGSGDMLGNTTYPGLQPWFLQQLLVWNAQDPVSAEETARNNASYTFQGNRNPFIDNSAYAIQIWGTPDSVPPTAPTNLATSNPTANSLTLNWTAATDNVGVVAYDVYVNGVYHSTVTSPTCTISGLSSNTPYSFYVIAKDLAGNSSPQSNTAQGTTSTQPSGGNCGTETFTDIPTTNPQGYEVRTWTTNGITWIATDARVDQTINGKAITIRNGSLTSTPITGGISSLTVTTQRKFGSANGTFNVKINGNVVGTVPYNANVTTTTISNINVSGDITIIIDGNSATGDRVAFDDLTWTCAGSLATNEVSAENKIKMYPNPVKNGTLYFSGKNLKNIKKAEIYSYAGNLIQTIENPFKAKNHIQLKNNMKGVFIIKLDEETRTFIIE